MSTPHYAARRLFEDLSTEVYYGLNLTIVLAEATVAERDAIRLILNRAKAARTNAVPAATNAKESHHV